MQKKYGNAEVMFLVTAVTISQVSNQLLLPYAEFLYSL